MSRYVAAGTGARLSLITPPLIDAPGVRSYTPAAAINAIPISGETAWQYLTPQQPTPQSPKPATTQVLKDRGFGSPSVI